MSFLKSQYELFIVDKLIGALYDYFYHYSKLYDKKF